MQYLRATKNLVLTIEADDIRVVKWWVDSSYAVHPDMRSHTGGALSLGKGVIYGTSTRQKLNTKSSTEAELVGLDDILPQVLWTRYFLEAQGYKVRDNVVYQDNMSMMLLAKNARSSSSKRTRHINVRYFFITDRLADFFTKPLQGSLFRRMRDFILNVNTSSYDGPNNTSEDHRSVLKNTDDGQTKATTTKKTSNK